MMNWRKGLEDIDLGGLESLCETCERCVLGYKPNTGPDNLCEGSYCDSAFEYYVEEIEEQASDPVYRNSLSGEEKKIANIVHNDNIKKLIIRR